MVVVGRGVAGGIQSVWQAGFRTPESLKYATMDDLTKGNQFVSKARRGRAVSPLSSQAYLILS